MTPRWGARDAIRNLSDGGDRVSITVPGGPKYFDVDAGQIVSRYRWDAISKYRLTNGLLAVYRGDQSLIVVPRAEAPPGFVVTICRQLDLLGMEGASSRATGIQVATRVMAIIADPVRATRLRRIPRTA